MMKSETNVRWIGDYMLYRIVQGPKSPGHNQVRDQPASLDNFTVMCCFNTEFIGQKLG